MHVQKSFSSTSTGALYLVGTPIGNLEDMTFRAIRTLKEVDLIAAEDTRMTRKLLTHYEITTRLVSYHEHNKMGSGAELVRMLKEGRQIALVSDAGLPAISDPGVDLVKSAAAEQIPVIPIPGANAALSALIVSGLSTERFYFAGFPPRDKKSLHQIIAQLAAQEGTLMFYESPHRVTKTLTAMLEVWGNRQVVMARELTKRHEEISRGSIEQCLDWLEQNPPLGEYCLLVEGADAAEVRIPAAEVLAWWTSLELSAHVLHYEEMTGNRKEAIRRAAQDRGMAKREVYNQIMKKDDLE